MKLLLAASTASLFFAAGMNASCGGGGTGGTGGETENPAIADVIYEGGATDEALNALLEGKTTTDATQAANITSPMTGAMVASSPAPTFTWKVGAVASNLTLSPSRTVASSAPSVEDIFVPFAPFAAPRVVTHLDASDHAAKALTSFLFSNVESAYAHGTPTSGPAFFLVFSTTANAKLLRIFTTNTSYTPDATALEKLKAAGDTIHAVVTHAEFDQNRIATDGGPFAGNEITFTVK